MSPQDQARAFAERWLEPRGFVYHLTHIAEGERADLLAREVQPIYEEIERLTDHVASLKRDGANRIRLQDEWRKRAEAAERREIEVAHDYALLRDDWTAARARCRELEASLDNALRAMQTLPSRDLEVQLSEAQARLAAAEQAVLLYGKQAHEAQGTLKGVRVALLLSENAQPKDIVAHALDATMDVTRLHDEKMAAPDALSEAQAKLKLAESNAESLQLAAQDTEKATREMWSEKLKAERALADRFGEALELLKYDVRLVLDGEPPERAIPCHHRAGDLRQAYEALAAWREARSK